MLTWLQLLLSVWLIGCRLNVLSTHTSVSVQCCLLRAFKAGLQNTNIIQCKKSGFYSGVVEDSVFWDDYAIFVDQGSFSMYIRYKIVKIVGPCFALFLLCEHRCFDYLHS